MDSKVKSQELFDNCYEDITRAYAAVKEDLRYSELEQLAVLKKIVDQEVGVVQSSSGMGTSGLARDTTEANSIKSQHKQMLDDNETHYDLCKAELLTSSRMSHFSLEERGLNDQHFEELEDDSDRSSSSSNSVTSVKELSDSASTPYFPQDSSGVEQTDFPA